MAYLILQSRRTRQPQYAVLASSYWVDRGLRFLLNPAVGPVNLVNGQYAIQLGGWNTSTTPSGISYAGAANYRAEFSPIGLNAAGDSLTLFAVWRSKSSAQYLGADPIGVVLSCRNTGNNGWSWSRNGASGGGDTGNVTRQRFTLNSVADYDEANYTIPSYVDTPVAFRANGTIGSWFSNGITSSANTTLGTKTVGDNLVLGATGPFSFNAGNWLDRLPILAAFIVPLIDSEIFSLSKNPWQLFAPDVRRLYFGAGGGTTDVTVALTGSAVTSNAGTAVANVAQALSGSAVTTSAGTVTPVVGVTVALSGSAVTATAGTLSVAISNALSGSAVTTSAGTITPSTGTFVALSGAAVTTSAGTLSVAVSCALSGSAVTVGAGTVTNPGQSIWTDVGVSAATWSDVGTATSIWTDL